MKLIRVKILETGELIELDINEIRIGDLLRKLGLSLVEHIVLRNNEIVTEEDTAVSGDELVVFTVKSGG
ncbi:MAG: MoaD/ThiS family protein [Desulfurococcaceae archaeon]